ncbi:MAG: hypothetical protein BGO78_09785 [Chloroflexi bacterium 44-23]|nr:MAG: hypothetical protein BGO78_09785 [Chloroflexi bacterium 44-23]
MKKILIDFSVMLISVLLISACNLPQKNSTPTSDPNFVFTAAALTVEAKIKENTPVPVLPTAMPPIETAIPPQPTIAVATITPIPTQAPTSTPTSLPCDAAKFIDDVTVPDDTVMAPGATFTKTWRLKNTGSCVWSTNYAIVFDSGTSMNGPASKQLTASVAPGQTVDISVDLKAPDKPDTYKANWKLRNANGVIFGLGNDNKPFWAQIKVASPTTQLFAVTSASFTINPSSYNGVCPTEITLVGKIKVSKVGTVTYTYQREDGFVSPVMTKNFDEAGEKNLVEYSMTLSSSWSGKIWLRIDEPNHQDFNSQQFSITCN